MERTLNREECLPLTAVVNELGYSANTLHKYFSILCQAVLTKWRERFDYERIEQRLNEVLNSCEEVLSVCELAREMNCPYHILYDKFTNLCQQISARRYIERKVRREEKMTEVGKNIRQAVLQLHDQKVYPSTGQTRKLLVDPHVLRTKEGRKAWLLALQELVLCS